MTEKPSDSLVGYTGSPNFVSGSSRTSTTCTAMAGIVRKARYKWAEKTAFKYI
jgi:menaquinone-dependent protoporphyrinogen IX oxidase